MKAFIGLVLAVALIGTVRCNDPGESIPGVLDLSRLIGLSIPISIINIDKCIVFCTRSD